jgi:translation initiation factor 3 subunit D
VANVFATDAILAHLMTCPRSVYPWDIVVQKLPGGTLFFDKRDAGQFDYLSVNETSNNPPAPIKADDDPQGVNTPERLSLEATMINQNFTQQILSSQVKKNRKHFDLPNPFFDEDDAEGMEPASVAYRYRKFDLGNDINLVCRTELHGIVPQNKKKGDAEDEEEYMTAFALNEIHPFSKATPGGPPVMNWRDKIDSQRGAVLATELKNNSFKLAKWTAQSILAGATQMKIGFVSRTSPKNAYEHVILGTQFYRPKEFATQITLSEQGMWAIIRFLIGVFEKQPEGKFVIMRDPNKAVLRIFRVPPNTFEEEDEEDEEEETKE